MRKVEEVKARRTERTKGDEFHHVNHFEEAASQKHSFMNQRPSARPRTDSNEVISLERMYGALGSTFAKALAAAQ